jgi:hypothetical protein
MEANNIKFHKDLTTEIKTEIEKSLKRSELETQRRNEELLDRFNAEISKCTHLISQVQKETEVELTIDNDNNIMKEKC